MKMSKFTKITLVSVAALIIILAAAFTAIGIASYKPTVVFYNINEKTQKAILSEIQSMPVGRKGKNLKYNVTVLDSALPLSAQKKAFKGNLLFATMDYDVQDAAKSGKIKKMDINLLEGMPTTTRNNALIKNNKICALPVLYDFYEIDVNQQAFYDSKIGKIADWNDFMSFLSKTATKDFYPLAFSGGEPEELLNFIGCLTEALSGESALKTAEDKLYQAFKTQKENALITALEELCKEDGALFKAVSAMRNIDTEKLCSNSSFSFTKDDTKFFIDNKLCNSVFLKLSDHRNIDSKVINEYVSIYVPGNDVNGERSFLAPTICAMPLKNNKSTNSTLKLLASSRQTSLSMKSTLAPAQASCGTPDKQADDVRFWLAASNGPVIPLSGAVPSAHMRKAAAEYIINLIRF